MVGEGKNHTMTGSKWKGPPAEQTEVKMKNRGTSKSAGLLVLEEKRKGRGGGRGSRSRKEIDERIAQGKDREFAT